MLQACLTALACQQLLLPRHTPAVSADCAIRAHDAVAGDDDREAIAGAGPGHRPPGGRRADRGGDLTVGARFAARDLPERVPDPELERSSTQIEWQITRGGLPFDTGYDLAQGGRQGTVVVRVLDDGVWKLRTQLALGVVAERDRAEPSLGRGDEHRAKGGAGNGVADANPLAAGFVAAGTHAEVRLLIGAAAGTKARLVNGIG